MIFVPLRKRSRAISLRIVVGLVLLAGPISTTAFAAGKQPATAASPRKIDYARDVEPIFKKHCVVCHGPQKQESSFRVDERVILLRGGDYDTPAVRPGNAAKSFLIRVVSGLDDDLVMPPKGKGRRLSDQQIRVLKDWINQGAKMPKSNSADGGKLKTDHWSFQPVGDAHPPKMTDLFVGGAIDAFVLKKLRNRRLLPSPRAQRRTLIRRLTLVMHGLPPTPAQVERFVNDDSPHAWKKLVDRVLDSPRYGERWARHWLDIVRFGETHGFETNRERPHAWHYRDWVIEAFNKDKPYDRFIREQIAGDALGEGIATGFLVAGPHDLVKSPDINLTLMQRQDDLAGIINTTGTTFLGLTLGCARCHNHKFDPITQQDYYSIQAVFAGVQHADRKISLSPDQKKKRAAIDERITTLRRRLSRFLPKAASGFRDAVSAKHNVETLKPVEVRFVRFTILETNSAEPCIDELEIFSAKQNVALATNGSKATCSGSFSGNAFHKLKHINDGVYGNGRSWISNERSRGWVQIELAKPAVIDRIEWSRDRESRYSDRLAIRYRIEGALEPGKWQNIASSRDRLPFGSRAAKQPVYRFNQASPELAKQGRVWLAEHERLQTERERLNLSTVYAGTFSQPGPTHRLHRGDPLAKREEVSPDAVRSIGTLALAKDAPEQQRRLKFAQWIAAANNPLTARVMVNRLWQYQFGTGLVDTPSDFGANGGRPTHPELLDWLAGEFMKNRWSIKHIQRLILMSNTWQQDSRPHVDAMRVDAASRLLWRFPPRRLEAEAIRDSLLAVSGVLDLRMGGPGFSAFEVEMENVRHYFPKKNYGPSDWRRMIYMTKIRQEQDSVFGNFDCPDASQVMPRRSVSTTPLQALNLFNSRFIMQQAALLAKRLDGEAGESSADRVQLAFRLCYSREATQAELSAAVKFAEQQSFRMLARAMFNSNEFLFIP